MVTRLARVTALLAVAVGFASSASFAQTGEDVIRFGLYDAGFTPRTVGLAGATVAGIGDWGASASNPASLGLVPRAHVTGSLDITTTGSETTTGFERSVRANRFSTSHGAYVVRIPTIRGRMNLGVGFQHTVSLDRRLFYIAEDGSAWADLYEVGWIGEISAAGAIEIAPRVLLGASLNVPIGSYDFTEQSGQTVSPSESFFLESSLRGFNARFGVIFDVGEGLRVGLAAETPTWLHVSERFGFHAPPDQRGSYTMQMPFRISTGAAFEYEGLHIGLDLALADWSQARLRPSARFAEENAEIASLLRETLDVRIGAEFDFGLGAARAGYALTQDPLRHEVEADRARHTFASGLSVYMARGMTLDVGLAYTEWRDQVFTLDDLVTERVGRFRGLVGMQFNL